MLTAIVSYVPTPSKVGEMKTKPTQHAVRTLNGTGIQPDIIVNNPEMVKRLAAVGLDWFVIGLESGSQRLLDLIHKGTTVEQNVEAIRICRQNGIKVFGTFMLGLPTETREESKQTADFINWTMPEIASPFWFTPIPGTGLYDYCVENGLLLNENPDVSIARTGVFMPRIKGVDYDYLRQIMEGKA